MLFQRTDSIIYFFAFALKWKKCINNFADVIFAILTIRHMFAWRRYLHCIVTNIRAVLWHRSVSYSYCYANKFLWNFIITKIWIWKKTQIDLNHKTNHNKQIILNGNKSSRIVLNAFGGQWIPHEYQVCFLSFLFVLRTPALVLLLVPQASGEKQCKRQIKFVFRPPKNRSTQENADSCLLPKSFVLRTKMNKMAYQSAFNRKKSVTIFTVTEYLKRACMCVLGNCFMRFEGKIPDERNSLFRIFLETSHVTSICFILTPQIPWSHNQIYHENPNIWVLMSPTPGIRPSVHLYPKLMKCKLFEIFHNIWVQWKQKQQQLINDIECHLILC